MANKHNKSSTMGDGKFTVGSWAISITTTNEYYGTLNLDYDRIRFPSQRSFNVLPL